MHRKKTIGRICISLILWGMPCFSLHSQTNSLRDQTNADEFYSPSGKWVAASNTNCLIWNSFPRAEESVTWSGAVVGGKAHGTGVVQWFTNGTPTTRYIGEIKGGLQDGHGTAFYYDLYSVEGDFKRGRLISKTVTIRNRGGWYKGEPNKNGQGEETMHGGVRYIGHFKQGRFDGAGVMIWPNGDSIKGQWKDSKLADIGTYTRTNGESFKVKMTEKGIEQTQ